MTFALPGAEGSYAVAAGSANPFVHQELIEVLYHTLWETVHVFFEHRELGHDVGQSGFLYPFLGPRQAGAGGPRGPGGLVDPDEGGRRRGAPREGGAATKPSASARPPWPSTSGSAGAGSSSSSATAARPPTPTTGRIDCVAPPPGMRPVPAVSLAMEPATVTAIANDVGTDVVFLRQLIAHAEPDDVAVAISTSGGSRNVIAALAEARKRGLLTVALLGYDGGEIRRQALADHYVVVGSDYIPRIQEVQASIYHTMRESLEELGHETR